MSNIIAFKDDAVCSSCGRYGALDLGVKYLCYECYEEMGSCCLEFGDHDLWKNINDKGDSPDS